jgi:Flp pilus assembly pilin Flp
MVNMMAPFVRRVAVVSCWLTKPEAGQTLIEYGLMLTLLAMAAVATLGIVGDDVRALFTAVETQVRNASTP